MESIKTEEDYRKSNLLLEDLLVQTEKIKDREHPLSKELERISNLIYDYENINYKIESPSRYGVFKLRVYEFFQRIKKVNKI